ncbi:MAG: MFS transporter [Clostridia bacterium]|nr:MFS transporter [Clostridia bacterium]
MKLNYKRTIFVGFAFFLICTFWQAYDNIIPKILVDKFGMNQTWSGLIMAMDNIFALFMLPLFGAISDKCHFKRGRRTPFIFVGTILAVVAFVSLSFVDAAQLKRISEVSAIDDPVALTVLYETEGDKTLQTTEGEDFVLREKFTLEEFTSISSQIENENGELATNPDYTNYVTPARQAYAWEMTQESPGTLILFMCVLLLALLSMSTFRSPAVALMPDVTIKPLRSKANAVINLMGTFGGIIVLGLGMVFGTGSVANSLMSYVSFFCVIAGIMLIALCLFMLLVKEPLWVKEMEQESIKHHIDEGESGEIETTHKLSKGELASLLLILASVVLWFMGYNAVTSKYSVYAGKVLSLDYNSTLMIANVAAIISYLPVGFIASKIGRKKSILSGVVMLAASFFVASFLREGSSPMLMNCMFALAGIGWATINVNSFPMVVELSRGGNVGKYTGFYYTASMAAQVATPIISGMFMDNLGMTTLFPYATILVAGAFVTMLFVKHGDSKPPKKNKLESFDVDN